VPSKSKKQKNFEKNIVFVGILSAADEKKQDSDPYQNVLDPQHCCFAYALPEKIVEGGSEEKPREDWEEKMVR
jgi:hypothetical protein